MTVSRSGYGAVTHYLSCWRMHMRVLGPTVSIGSEFTAEMGSVLEELADMYRDRQRPAVCLGNYLQGPLSDHIDMSTAGEKDEDQ